jgi:sugar/nucleoside kinase (ribokinase family)
MPDIISIGESLIDFLSVEKNVLIENTTGFSIAPGGAPANVAAAVAKLGGSSGFIGKVGEDSFGRMIKNTLRDAGVNVDLILLDKRVNTTLAFISVRENGEPDYTFYRNHCGADLALHQEELNEGYIKDSKILHFGSISFIGEPLKSATLKAMNIAQGANRILSFDPNLRPSLWDNLRHAKLEIENGLQLADIVKVTDEEMEFITGENNLTKGTDVIIKYGPRIVIVTRGPRSCFYNDGQIAVEVPAFEVEHVDTTGAGDAFIGGILCKILERIEKNQAIFSIEKDEIIEILRFAHACGAVTVLRKGVIPALPTLPEVEKFLKEQGNQE